jgi:hypothetical protein
MKEIEVLVSGCANYKATFKLIDEAAEPKGEE